MGLYCTVCTAHNTSRHVTFLSRFHGICTLFSWITFLLSKRNRKTQKQKRKRNRKRQNQKRKRKKQNQKRKRKPAKTKSKIKNKNGNDKNKIDEYRPSCFAVVSIYNMADRTAGCNGYGFVGDVTPGKISYSFLYTSLSCIISFLILMRLWILCYRNEKQVTRLDKEVEVKCHHCGIRQTGFRHRLEVQKDKVSIHTTILLQCGNLQNSYMIPFAITHNNFYYYYTQDQRLYTDCDFFTCTA